MPDAPENSPGSFRAARCAKHRLGASVRLGDAGFAGPAERCAGAAQRCSHQRAIAALTGRARCAQDAEREIASLVRRSHQGIHGCGRQTNSACQKSITVLWWRLQRHPRRVRRRSSRREGRRPDSRGTSFFTDICGIRTRGVRTGERRTASCAGARPGVCCCTPSLPPTSASTWTVLPDAISSKKLYLAAIRHLFDILVTRHAVVLNPAASVRGERYQVIEGKTPEITIDQARRLLSCIDVSHVVGLRDRAIIATLIYTAARIGAVAGLRLRRFLRRG